MNKLTTVSLLLLAALALTWVAAEAKNAVRLQDVQVLTFSKDEYSEGRRRSGVPQLHCTGGSAKGQYEPYTAMCKNIGFDGRDVAWKCEADLPAEFTLGKVTVTCEGYDYPEDSYVLKDSCALEYNLEFSELGKRTGYHPENFFATYSRNTIVRDRGFLGNIFYTLKNLVVGIIMLPFNILSWVFTFVFRGTTTFLKLITAAIALMVGISVFKGISQSRAQKQHYVQPVGRAPYTAKTTPGGLAGGSEDRSTGPGFWSGVMGGGLVSYYLNRRKNQSTSAGIPPQQMQQRPIINDPNNPAAYPVPEEHHSEAYGKTTRR